MARMMAPLRKIIERTTDFDHLECGHKVEKARNQFFEVVERKGNARCRECPKYDSEAARRERHRIREKARRKRDAELGLSIPDPIGAEGWTGNQWERQPGENDREWSAFLAYRDMEPGSRGLWKAEIEWRKKVPSGRRDSTQDKAIATLQRTHAASGTYLKYKTMWRWAERIEAFDRHLDLKRIEARKRRLVAAEERHADQAEAVGRALAMPAETLMEKLANGDVNELENLSQKELLQLVQYGAQSLIKAQQGERLALGSVENAAQPVQTRKITQRADLLRQILADPEKIGMLERVSVEVSEQVEALPPEEVTAE